MRVLLDTLSGSHHLWIVLQQYLLRSDKTTEQHEYDVGQQAYLPLCCLLNDELLLFVTEVCLLARSGFWILALQVLCTTYRLTLSVTHSHAVSRPLTVQEMSFNILTFTGTLTCCVTYTRRAAGIV